MCGYICVAENYRIKFGQLKGSTTTQLTLGSGFLFYSIGGSHSGCFHLDYWSPEISLIGGKSLEGLGTIEQSESSRYVFNISLNEDIKLSYFFIGAF